jgi:DNA-binding CsgD family transcriptional regulator
VRAVPGRLRPTGPIAADAAAAYRLAGLLTPREYEVAALAAAGKTNREIAERLSVSYRTVENTSIGVLTKLHLRGRDDLRELLGGPPP